MISLTRIFILIVVIVGGCWLYTRYFQDRWTMTAFITELKTKETVPITNAQSPIYKSKKECQRNLSKDINEYGVNLMIQWSKAFPGKYQVEFKCWEKRQPSGFFTRFYE